MKPTRKKQDRRESPFGEMNLLPASSTRTGKKSPEFDGQSTDARRKVVSGKRSSFQDFTFG